MLFDAKNYKNDFFGTRCYSRIKPARTTSLVRAFIREQKLQELGGEAHLNPYQHPLGPLQRQALIGELQVLARKHRSGGLVAKLT